MTWYDAVVLGVLQGATEFLPVSSSGHLVMGQALLGVQAPGASLEIALHAATLLSVLIVYRSRLRTLIVGVLQGDRDQLAYAGLLVLASVPAAIAGLGFGGFFESLFDLPVVAAAALLVTGFVVWTAKRAMARGPSGPIDPASALLMGIAQAAAIVPGISRSGSTVVTALWRGVNPKEAAAFSFLMSIPPIGGATLLELLDVGTLTAQPTIVPATLLLSAAAACVTGIAAIRIFRAMLANRSFHVFAPYLWLVGAMFLWTAVS